jgi:hypothetical protein
MNLRCELSWTRSIGSQDGSHRAETLEYFQTGPGSVTAGRLLLRPYTEPRRLTRDLVRIEVSQAGNLLTEMVSFAGRAGDGYWRSLMFKIRSITSAPVVMTGRSSWR